MHETRESEQELPFRKWMPYRGVQSVGRRRDRRRHRPTFPLFFSPPLVFSALASKKVFPSPFSFFPFVFISGIQSAQRKDITKEGKRAQRRSGRRSTRERAIEILQVRGLLPRPPPPPSSPAPPPRFPAPPPAPPIPAGTARADTTPAGALGCCCRSRFSGGARGGGSCGATRAVPALDGSIEG